MGLLDKTTQANYYQGNNYGDYQFVSLEDVINQFIVIYTGEEKVISKAKRTDIAFHAQRALAELSFDTFKSVKTQEIILPPSLTMILPHDYVNYTKLLYSDSAGIKHPIYPTKHTQNPFKILQDDDGNYNFAALTGNYVLDNSDFSSDLVESTDWSYSSPISGSSDSVSTNNGVLEFKHNTESLQGSYTSRHYAVWQQIDVTEYDVIHLSAKALSTSSGTDKNIGKVRVGLSTAVLRYPGTSTTQQIGSPYSETITGYDPNKTNPNLPSKPTFNMDIEVFDLQTIDGDASVITFESGDDTLSTTAVELNNINVSDETLIYVLISSDGGHTGASGAEATQTVDDITLTYEGTSDSLLEDGESTTWSNYKSKKPSENQNNYQNNYQSNIYSPNNQQRYGLDPQHAQGNGSFYIDGLRGLIHFSSNLSGSTIVLDYISDSLGTDGEMRVHKLAEEAMYKWISHAILSTRINTPEYVITRAKKEKFAATRQAKLRLSNIKLEEITQILRGKSKWIKH